MKDNSKMEIDKDKEATLGLIKVITKASGLLTKWMGKEFMLILKFNFKATSKTIILLDRLTDISYALFLGWL